MGLASWKTSIFHLKHSLLNHKHELCVGTIAPKVYLLQGREEVSRLAEIKWARLVNLEKNVHVNKTL